MRIIHIIERILSIIYSAIIVSSPAASCHIFLRVLSTCEEFSNDKNPKFSKDLPK